MARPKAGVTAKAIHLASEYGVSNALIGMIKHDRLWRHVA